MIYRKGELSKSTINRDWPHQLVLPADFVRGKNCIQTTLNPGARIARKSMQKFMGSLDDETRERK